MRISDWSSDVCSSDLLYMTIVGVVADDDVLFETGLRSVYSALDDLNENGALQFAMRRGWRAIHYQNYSLLYLVTTMQIAYRQGYDLFRLAKDGIGFREIGRAHVCTPVTNAHLVCRLLLAKKKHN